MDKLKPYEDSLTEKKKTMESLVAELNPIQDSLRSVAVKLQDTAQRMASCIVYVDKTKRDIAKTETLMAEKKDAVKVEEVCIYE
jgi:peptidoglycan hydrolase CwlO-like protein